MRSFNNTKTLVLLGLAAISVSACGTTSNNPNELGGAYMVTVFPGLPATGNQPAVAADPFGPDQFRQMQHLDVSCDKQLDPQLPGVVGQVAQAGVRQVPTILLGGVATGRAAHKHLGADKKRYTNYARDSIAGSVLGGAIANGIDRKEIGDHTAKYACMQGFVARASQKGQLKGVNPVPWTGLGNSKPIKMPAATAEQAYQATQQQLRTSGQQLQTPPAGPDEESLPAPVMPR